VKGFLSIDFLNEKDAVSQIFIFQVQGWQLYSEPSPERFQ